jgi:hypothetical protein
MRGAELRGLVCRNKTAGRRIFSEGKITPQSLGSRFG